MAQLSLHSKVFQYADDTALLLVSESYMAGIKLMQEDISKLITWFHSNFIFFNHDKTQLTCFHSPFRKIDSSFELFLHEYSCNNCTCQSLNYLTKVKYLGLFLDDKLSFIHHIEHVARKLRAVCGVIYKLRTVCDVRLRKMLYKSLGESILRYGITIYGWASKEKLNILNTIIRKIARNVVYQSTCSTAAIGDILCSHSMMTVQKLLVATLLTKHLFLDKYKIKNKKTRALRHIEPFIRARVYTGYGKRTRAFYVPLYFNKFLTDSSVASASKLKKRINDWVESNIE